VRFDCEQWVAASRDEVFTFFSSAENLEAITPPWLHFQVTTPSPITIHQGTIIDYRLRIHGIPLRWQSAISTWEPPHRFVDEQRRGPYTRWVHTHTFVEECGGTTIRDSVDFDVPFAIVSKWFVQRDVRAIFAFRQSALASIARAGWSRPRSGESVFEQ
jgi:ligand-binding SRPBCC domain-containing protein